MLVSAAIYSLTFLFFSGDVKGSLPPALLPVDLTAACAAAALWIAGVRFLLQRRTVPTHILWMITLFSALSISMAWTTWTSYSILKCERLFTFALLSALLPMLILASIAEVAQLVRTMVAVGAIISAGALLQLGRGVSSYERITGFNSDTISLGRNAGIALVGLYTMLQSNAKHRFWKALLCLPLLVVLLASGSRGPVLFALLVVGFVTVRWSLGSKRALFASIATIGVASALLSQQPQLMPEGSMKRIEQFLEQRYDSSSAERVLAGRAALQSIRESPLGLGIGGFASIYSFGRVTDRIYPHNVVLEVAVENGWYAGGLFLFMLCLGLWRAYRGANESPRLRSFFAVYSFVALNALVSGDLNDNRILFALLSIALLIARFTAHENKAIGEPAETAVSVGMCAPLAAELKA